MLRKFKEKNKNLLRLKLKSALKIEQICEYMIRAAQHADTLFGEII
jgi:hypothetical protein